MSYNPDMVPVAVLILSAICAAVSRRLYHWRGTPALWASVFGQALLILAGLGGLDMASSDEGPLWTTVFVVLAVSVSVGIAVLVTKKRHSAIVLAASACAGLIMFYVAAFVAYGLLVGLG